LKILFIAKRMIGEKVKLESDFWRSKTKRGWT